eukprot:5106187-Amphidinium_carterae.1
MHIRQSSGQTVLQSWKEAVQKRSGGNRPEGNFTVLQKVLARMAVYTPTTSGVEQTFTKFKWVMGEISPQARARHAHSFQ